MYICMQYLLYTTPHHTLHTGHLYFSLTSLSSSLFLILGWRKCRHIANRKENVEGRCFMKNSDIQGSLFDRVEICVTTAKVRKINETKERRRNWRVWNFRVNVENLLSWESPKYLFVLKWSRISWLQSWSQIRLRISLCLSQPVLTNCSNAFSFIYLQFYFYIYRTILCTNFIFFLFYPFRLLLIPIFTDFNRFSFRTCHGGGSLW